MDPLLFCLVLHQVVCATATDSECASLLFHRWYIDDGIVDSPISAVLRVLSIIKDLGPPLSLHINLSKCELFSINDLSRFPDEIKNPMCLILIYLTWGPNRRFFVLCHIYCSKA